ncbi:MAG: EAL domain-containing protein [Sulfuricellaceae bacterium]|nr:EAL domain-containing protein [Sulfuricellaceae bacterium]
MKSPSWLPLIEGMLEAVLLVDPIDLKIVASNRAADVMLGLSTGALIGKPVVDLASTPEDVFFWEDVAAGLSEQICSQTLIKRASGESIHVERQVSLVQMGSGSTIYLVAIRDESDRYRVEDELERLIAELRATLESTADGILVTDMEGAIRGYNHRFADMWSLPGHLLTQRDDAAVFAWMAQNVLDVNHYAAKVSLIFRTPLLEATDTIVLRSGKILERVTLPQYARGRPIGRVYSFRDVTQLIADESRLQLASKVFEASMDAIFVTDADHLIVTANPACERLTGFSQQELLGKSLHDFVSKQSDAAFVDKLLDQLGQGSLWEGELLNQSKNGAPYLCLASLVRVQNEEGGALHYVGFFRDLTETHAARKRIEELAYNDLLTGLPNRLLLSERIQQALVNSDRSGSRFAIMFLDLDHFKKINDSLGHLFGDRVLVEVAERLKDCLRQVDTASRLGGDEFVLLLHQTDGKGAEVTARRVIEALKSPFIFDDMAFSVTCSIGIALYPDDGLTMDDLIKNADSAMYHVKERGRSDFRFYQRQMNIGLLSRMKLDHAMRQAIEHGHFRVHYQPQIDLKSGEVFGAEALIRWHDKDLGHISPARFIPVAEESGVIVPIGNWVLSQAVAQARLWLDKGWKISVAVNVSALQFQQADFVETVANALNLAGLPAERLELELTESILIRDADIALERLQQLADLGIKLSIDDFGTGYSSLSYLKRFPISKLKIDKSFVDDLPDESDAAIVTAIINLARALKMRVIAEGVETDAQRDFLFATGCDEFQGYLCSPAIDCVGFEKLVELSLKQRQIM